MSLWGTLSTLKLSMKVGGEEGQEVSIRVEKICKARVQRLILDIKKKKSTTEFFDFLFKKQISFQGMGARGDVDLQKTSACS